MSTISLFCLLLTLAGPLSVTVFHFKLLLSQWNGTTFHRCSFSSFSKCLKTHFLTGFQMSVCLTVLYLATNHASDLQFLWLCVVHWKCHNNNDKLKAFSKWNLSQESWAKGEVLFNYKFEISTDLHCNFWISTVVSLLSYFDRDLLYKYCGEVFRLEHAEVFQDWWMDRLLFQKPGIYQSVICLLFCGLFVDFLIQKMKYFPQNLWKILEREHLPASTMCKM